MILYTLQVYLAPDEGDAADLEIWCEPVWEIRTSAGIVTSSATIRGPNDYGDPADMAQASATITEASKESKVLVDQTLLTLTVDATTHALQATFSDGIVISTFVHVDEPETSTQWVLRDRARNIAIRGTSRGIAEGSRATG